MSSLGDWVVPPAVQPHAEDYDFDLEAALSSVVGVRSLIPSDAFTAETLGDERHGNGVLLSGGLVLTIGYLIVEAEIIWLSFSDGSAVQGHTLGYDQQTGFALVQPLARMDLPFLEIGCSADAKVEDRVVIGSPGGAERSVAGHVIARQEFAGYWEYMLDEAIFTTPPHPHWSGSALIDDSGGTLTAPILGDFYGVICAGGTVRSHLGIISREFRVPCLMNVKMLDLPDGTVVEVEYGAEAQTQEAYQGGESKTARVWKRG